MWRWILLLCALCDGRAAEPSLGEFKLAGQYRVEGRGTVRVQGEGDLLLLQLSYPDSGCEFVVERSVEGLVKRVWSRGEVDEEAVRAGRELVSLLQLPPDNTLYSRREVDAFGDCLATYRPRDTGRGYFKLRTECRWEGGADAPDELSGGLVSRRLTDVQLDSRGVLQRVATSEEHKLRGLTVLYTITLVREEDLSPALTARPMVDDLGPLVEHPLLPPRPPPPLVLTPPAETVAQVLSSERTALAALLHDGELSEDVARVAMAAGKLVRALRAAPGQLAAAALNDPSSRSALLMCAGTAGLPPSAVLTALQPDSPHDRDLLELYLGTLAGSPNLEQEAARQAARLASGKWGERVRHAAELCAAVGGAADSLPRCSGSDEGCAERRLRAGAVGLNELVREAAAGSAGAVATLESHETARLTPQQKARLASAATREDLPVATRAAALVVAVRGALEHGVDVDLPEWLAELCVNLHGAGAVRDVLWGLLRELSAARPDLLASLTRLRRRHPHLDNWFTRATEGDSSVIRREVCAGGAAGVCGVLWSVQVVSEGAVRGGRVSLHVGDGTVLAAVDVSARGLADTDQQDAAAELAVTLGGARRVPLELFTGRADLLAKLWGGAATSPRLLAAHIALIKRNFMLPSGAGSDGWLRGETSGTLLLRMTARGDASLWNRAADAALWLHAGFTWNVTLLNEYGAGDGSWQLAVGAQLDFYSEPRLCVHADLPLHKTRTDTVPRRVTRLAGRSLALDRRNDRACADMR